MAAPTVLRIVVAGWQDEPSIAAWLGAPRRRRVPGPTSEDIHALAGALNGTATWEVPHEVAARRGNGLWRALEELHESGHEIRLVERAGPEAVPMWAIGSGGLQLPQGLPQSLARDLASRSASYRTIWHVVVASPSVTDEASAEGLPQPPMPGRPLDPLEKAAQELASRASTASGAAKWPEGPSSEGRGIPVTLVVPCYQELGNVPFLLRTLDEVVRTLAPRWEVRPLLVDDGSDDGTVELLTLAIGDRPRDAVPFRLHCHPENRGIAAAIQTGLGLADTEYAASMDADGSYDPAQLAELLPHLLDGADLVTGSPYHPEGHVRNVPPWRLVLSQGLSRMYRATCRVPVHTFTSCFRAYRTRVAAEMRLSDGRYLGIAELLLRLHARGASVREVPSTLETRLYGVSKIRTARVILGHLKLWVRASLRLVR